MKYFHYYWFVGKEQTIIQDAMMNSDELYDILSITISS